MTSEVLADNEDLLHQLSAELGLGALLQDPGPAQVSDREIERQRERTELVQGELASTQCRY
jgi:hypothetical protein